MSQRLAVAATLFLSVAAVLASGCSDTGTSSKTNRLTLSVESDGKFRWDFRPLAPAATVGGFQQADNEPTPGFSGTSDVSLTIHGGPKAPPLKLNGSLTREPTRKITFDGELTITEQTRITIEGMNDLEMKVGGELRKNGHQFPAGEYKLTFSGVAN